MTEYQAGEVLGFITQTIILSIVIILFLIFIPSRTEEDEEDDT
jgi:competence protein ComGC